MISFERREDDRPMDLRRGTAAARVMSDTQLAELHGKGREALRFGAWEVLDEELRRRVRSRRTAKPVPAETKYPAMRVTVVLLKITAVGVFLIGLVTAYGLTAGLGGFIRVGALVVAALVAIGYWASAELLVLLMDIEANTRAGRNSHD